MFLFGSCVIPKRIMLPGYHQILVERQMSKSGMSYRIRPIKRTVRVEVGKIFCRRDVGNYLFYRTPQWLPVGAFSRSAPFMTIALAIPPLTVKNIRDRALNWANTVRIIVVPIHSRHVQWLSHACLETSV